MVSSRDVDVMAADSHILENQVRVRLAFDRIADRMDEVLVRNPINEWMHRVNLGWIRHTFPPGCRLLELGCGTGRDALTLAAEGRRIFALDISPMMVRRAEEKAATLGLESAKFTCGRNQDLLDLLRFSPWKQFDGGYANFSLTYEESLEGIAQLVSRVLVPGARFVCTLPNRTVLVEVALYGPLLRFDKLLWRFRNPLMKDVHGTDVRIRAYSPGEVRKAFESWFELEKIVGLPTFVPPVYLHEQYRRLGSFRNALERLDTVLSSRFPWNRLGEHTLYLFRNLVLPR